MKVACIYICLLSYYLLKVVAVEQKDESKSSDVNSCECGLFNATKTATGLSPLMSQTLLLRGCDERGEKDCTALCVNLAHLFKENGPTLICNHLGHVDRLKGSVFSRSCGKEWIFTGTECEYSLCCHDKKQVDCVTGKEVDDAVKS